jgi:hypothetical protein
MARGQAKRKTLFLGIAQTTRSRWLRNIRPILCHATSRSPMGRHNIRMELSNRHRTFLWLHRYLLRFHNLGTLDGGQSNDASRDATSTYRVFHLHRLHPPNGRRSNICLLPACLVSSDQRRVALFKWCLLLGNHRPSNHLRNRIRCFGYVPPHPFKRQADRPQSPNSGTTFHSP